MRRFPVRRGMALLAAAALAGCGEEERAPRAKEPAPASNPCATSKQTLAVRDLVGRLPRGTDLVPAESEMAKGLAADYRKAGGRSVDVQEVRRRDGDLGTVVIVANVTRKGTEAEVIDGLREAAQEEGLRFREVDVAGRNGGMVSGPGFAQVAALAGPCAVVSITGDNERRVLAVVRGLRPA